MLKRRRGEGVDHPLIRALGEGPIDRIIDATLGLALDALHIAEVLAVPVIGFEASAPIYSLLEEGLPRIARSPVAGRAAAARIEPRFGDAADLLAREPPASAAVVYLDPPFATPRAAIAGFTLLRRFAAPFDLSRVLPEALRVARDRVVIKLGHGDPLPELGVPYERREGSAIDFVAIAATRAPTART